jgi:hypothetical protein
MITIPIEIGDVILAGKFKNHKVTVKEIGVDDYGLPTVNGKGIMKIRVEKLIPKKVEEMNTIKEAPAKNDPKIQRVVDQINALIKSAVDSDGDPIPVTDKSGTWEEPEVYLPIVYANGNLKITTQVVYGTATNTHFVKKADMEFDGIPELRNIAKLYKKAIKDYKSGKLTTESRMKLSKKETVAIKKVLRNRISEGIDNRSIDVKIKKEDGTYWFFLQLDNDREENITNVGFETIELARHAARMKGFNIVDDKDDKQDDSFNKRPDSMTPPKPTKREKTPDTETPKEIDLGKEKTIKLEEAIKRIIRKEISRLKEDFADFDSDDVRSSVINYLYGCKYRGAKVDAINKNLQAQGSDLEGNLINATLENLQKDGQVVLIGDTAYIREFAPKNESAQKKKRSLTETPKVTKKIQEALLELKGLQEQLAAAQAQMEEIKKKTNFDALQKRADQILKEQLWDFLEELKKDETRILKLKDIVLKINRHQASPATYNYEQVLDKVMEWVNQDVKAKILAELKATEKFGKTKANVSFTTEGIGDIWDSIKNILGRLIPALQSKGDKIDNAIADFEQQTSN